MKNTITLTKQLIQIPSYKDGEIFESRIGNFLSDYMQRNFPYLSVTKQYVAKNRYNLFIKDAYPTKLLVVDQIDTVMPSKDWLTDPCAPVEENGKIYGLGSSDSKGSVAAFLTALGKIKETKGLAMLWYVDEEYDFKGMKTFVTSPLARAISPQYILSIDGDSLQIGRGCRGVIEIKLVIKGQTGHSARNIGVNVNKQFIELIRRLEEWLLQFQSAFLGRSTLNIARINSGLFKETKNETVVFGEEGNRIPDYLETILEIRTTSSALNFKALSTFLAEQTKALNMEILTLENRFDLQGYETDKEKVSPFLRLFRMKPTSFLDPSNFGFLDVALLKKRYPTATVFSLGAGSPDQAHSANEYITLSNLQKATTMYTKFLKNFVEKGGEKMIERNVITVEAKNRQTYQVKTYDKETITPDIMQCLSIAYATDFWAGSWKELLVTTTGQQFGTFDASGEIYPETAALMRLNGIDLANTQWPRIAWEKAGAGELRSTDGSLLNQFWTITKAQEEIQSFLESPENAGFGGELMLLSAETGEIVGFTAYAVSNATNGAQLAQKRFPYDTLLIDGNVVERSLADVLETDYNGEETGVFLDFAVSERCRGEGLGSILFDMRLQRLVELGAQSIVGRTIKTSPAQYYGNYIARGMQPIAFDPKNPDKGIFYAKSTGLTSRQPATNRR